MDGAAPQPPVLDPLAELELQRARRKARARLFGGEPEPVRVGRFELLEPVGQGAMGVVHAARDPELDRRLALKFLRGGPGVDLARAGERLRREARALAQLSHPNVVGVYEVGEHEGHPFIAMELVEGQSLAERIAAGALSAGEALEVIVQVARGLAAAHDRGLLHRDIKPANILIGDDGRARLSDFGLVGSEGPATAEGTRLTREGSPLGTPAYMAPEQRQGGMADARSDIYALCATAFEALYGMRPSEVGVEAERLRTLEARRAEVPAAVREVIARGLREDPRDRFESGASLAEALEPKLVKQAEVATAQRGSRWLWAVGAGVLVIVVGALWAGGGSSAPAPSSDAARAGGRGEHRPAVAAGSGYARMAEASTHFGAGRHRECLQVALAEPLEAHLLTLASSCAFQLRDRKTMVRICDSLDARFPNAPGRMSCRQQIEMHDDAELGNAIDPRKPEQLAALKEVNRLYVAEDYRGCVDTGLAVKDPSAFVLDNVAGCATELRDATALDLACKRLQQLFPEHASTGRCVLRRTQVRTPR